MGSVFARLAAMMFLQYFIWGAWAVAAGGYLLNVLHFEGRDVGSLYSTNAIGAMLAPLFVGYFADRFFNTERILAVLHLVGGGLLCLAAQQTTPGPLFWVMLAYSLCYMPTLALTNSLSFRNVQSPEKEFPYIRLFGTLGWIAAGLVVGFLLPGGSNAFFYLAAIASFAQAGLSLILPATPPQVNEGSPDALGLGALGLFKSPSFAVFAVCSLLICIPLAFYYNFANAFLDEIGVPAPTALMTLGQVSEVFFMALMPLFIRALGVKWMLAIGMLAWVIRYLSFGSLSVPMIIVGLLLHGICYDFFFVASQIYVDGKAPANQRAGAQSLIAFLTLGVGMYLGAWVAGAIVDQYPGFTVPATRADGTVIAKAPLPNWQVNAEPAAAANHGFFTDLNNDGKLNRNELPGEYMAKGKAEDPLDDVLYKQQALDQGLQAADSDKDGAVTQAEWRNVQAHQWSQIWMWPAGMAAITLVLFVIGFHDRVKVPETGHV